MPHRALQKAADFLSSLAKEHETEKGGFVFPPMEELAKVAQVSRGTMLKAASHLADRGTIVIVRGTGIILKPTGFPLLAPAARALVKWRQAKERMLAEITSGPYRDERLLPRTKELIEIYGADYRTIRKALVSLVNDGYLTAYKNRFAIRRRSSRHQATSLVLVTAEELLANMAMPYYASRFREFTAALEKECSRRNVSLARETYPDVLANPRRYSETTGFLVWSDLVWQHETVLRLVDSLAPLRKQIAIIDIEGTKAWTLDSRAFPTVSVFRVSDIQAGEHVARPLIAEGHRRVAYFALNLAGDLWSMRRYQGIAQAFRKAHLTAKNVVSFDRSAQPDPAKAAALPARFQPHGESFWGAVKAVESSLSTEEYGRALRMQVSTFEYYRMVRELMEPDFARALLDKRITAWILEGDSMALHAALPFLDERKIRVPQDISVATFDDTWSAFSRGLTTFNFDMDKVPFRVLNLLLAAPRRNSAPRQEIPVYDIGGTVLLRRSLGPARIS